MHIAYPYRLRNNATTGVANTFPEISFERRLYLYHNIQKLPTAVLMLDDNLCYS